MCGIVGILGRDAAAPRIVDALKRLEYRGYDSAGVATLEAGNVLMRERAAGKLGNLETALQQRASDLEGSSGIGHTRWATHGAPTTVNAHPHVGKHVAVVHNGIIENYKELKSELQGQGIIFETDTDTEIVAHYVSNLIDNGSSPREAIALTLPRLSGAFSLAFLFEGEGDLLIAARKGSPLAVGYGENENYLGSDAIALSPFTNKITYLDEGDWAVITRNSVEILNSENKVVERPVVVAATQSLVVDKGNHRHFMLKEIFEQPEVVQRTLSQYLDYSENRVLINQDLPFDFNDLGRISITACGTAFYAGLIGKYWIEKFARIPVEIDIASEFRYRELPLPKKGVALFITQSGETADTLACLRYCRENGQTIASIVNVPESTIARESDVVFSTLAGPEIGVASTKAFTCQLSVLLGFAVAAGVARGHINRDDEQKLAEAMAEIPRYMTEAMETEEQIKALAHKLSKASDVLYLGRNTNYPLAMEGALKLKEISYIHAEGYAAGELKHGPIALIDETMPVVVLAPYDAIFDKTLSNLQEVAARDGRIILITDQKGADIAGSDVDDVIIMPTMLATIAPLAYAIPIQLLAYHTAVFMGTDVDQPRNLAKSVTVE